MLLPPLPSLPPLWMARIFGEQSQKSNGKDNDDSRTPTINHLVFTGYTVLQLGITTWLNDRYPKNEYANITTKLTKMMAKKPASWSKLYKLPTYFTVSKIQKESKNPFLSKGNLFAAYIGAIYSDTGSRVSTTNNFIRSILNFEAEEGSAESDGEDEILPNKLRRLPEGTSGGGVHSRGNPVSPMNNGKRPTTVSPPLSPGENGQNALSRFNELATQKRVIPLWNDEVSGPDHVRIWVATLSVEGHRFEGQGNSKKQARASAADMALKGLQWI